MKKKDFILIIVVLVIVSLGFVFNYIVNSKHGKKVEIYVDNKLYARYDINIKKTFKIKTKEGYNIVKIHDNGVEITEASCPDKVCVHTGFITKPSQSIVCLPNKVQIKIVSDDNEDKDEDVISK